MPGDYLTARVQNVGGARGGSVELYRLLGGWKAERIDTAASPHLRSKANTTLYHPRDVAKEWIQDNGSRFIPVLASNNSFDVGFLYDWDVDGAAWVARTGTSSQPANEATGFVVVTGSDGQEYLCSAGWSNNGGGELVVTVDSGAGGTLDFTGQSSPNAPFMKAVAFRGLMHVKQHINSGASDLDFYTYDPVTGAVTFQSLGTFGRPSPGHQAFVQVGKRLFYITPNGTSSRTEVLEFVAGSWVVVGSSDSEFPDLVHWTFVITGYQAEPAFWNLSDTQTLMIGGWGPTYSNRDGLGAWLFDVTSGTLVVTDVTDPVIPTFLRSGTTIGSGGGNFVYGLSGVTDLAEVPGTPQHYLYFNPSVYLSQQNAWSFWRVIDEATQIQLIETVEANGDYAMPNGSYGGADNSFYPAGEQIQVMETSEDAQGLRVRYRCRDDPGNADKTVRLRYTDSFAAPVSIGTLVAGSAVGGGAVVGNEVQGVDADETIDHEFVWDFLADGISNASRAHIVLEIERP